MSHLLGCLHVMLLFIVPYVAGLCLKRNTEPPKDKKQKTVIPKTETVEPEVFEDPDLKSKSHYDIATKTTAVSEGKTQVGTVKLQTCQTGAESNYLPPANSPVALTAQPIHKEKTAETAESTAHAKGASRNKNTLVTAETTTNTTAADAARKKPKSVKKPPHKK